jgi:acyl-CoA reductase-like NAD-dependent aldehyde dehydrogenase
MVQLDPTTVGIVEVGLDEGAAVTAKYYDFQSWVPVPRRRVARVLRMLADNLEATAAELERSEQP